MARKYIYVLLVRFDDNNDLEFDSAYTNKKAGIAAAAYFINYKDELRPDSDEDIYIEVVLEKRILNVRTRNRVETIINWNKMYDRCEKENQEDYRDYP